MEQIRKHLWQFNLTGHGSLTSQIESLIINLITTGALVPGEKLISYKELAKILAVNKNTVDKAYKNLKDKNILESCHRRGTYVPELRYIETEDCYSVPAPFSFHEPYEIPSLQVGDHPSLFLGSAAPHPSVCVTPRFSNAYKKVTDRLSYQKTSNLSINDMLYEPLVQHLKSRKIHVRPSQVAVIDGVQCALRTVVSLIVKPNDNVVLSSPSDLCALSAFRPSHAKIHFTGTDDQGMLIDELEELCKKMLLKVVYTRPPAEYPAMTMLSEPRRRRLLQLAEKYHFVIIEMDEEHEFWHREPLPPLVSRYHDGRVIHVSPLSRVAYRFHAMGLVTGPVDFISILRTSTTYPGTYRDLVFEDVALELIADKSIYHIASGVCSYYKKIMDQLPILLENYLGDYVTYQLPSAGLSIGLQFKQMVDLTSVLPALEQIGYYHCGKGWSSTNRYLFSNLNIGIGCANLKTLEEALKLILKAIKGFKV